MKRLIITIILAFLFNTHTPAFAESSKIPAVASFSIIGDMVKRIAGDTLDLHIIVDADSDAHGFEPTPADVRHLTHARLVFFNGLGFEGWMERLLQSSEFSGSKVIVSQGIEALENRTHGISHADHEHEHHHGDEEDAHADSDPHSWQNVRNAMIYAANIRDALIAHDPQNKDVYTNNAKAYIAELSALDSWVREQINSIPKEARVVITSHDAFFYFAQAYGVTFLAPLGVDSKSDVSAKDITRLIDHMRKHNVRALFVENISDPRLIEQLEREGKARIGGVLYSDALSKPDGNAPSYVAMIRHNVTALVAAMKQ